MEESIVTIFQIECFLNVAKYLNFTEAANHLFIAQSSLEKDQTCKQSLASTFFCTKKYVRLTPGGAVLYQELSVLLDQGRNAIEKAKKAGLGQEGSISLGVIESQPFREFSSLRAEYSAGSSSEHPVAADPRNI